MIVWKTWYAFFLLIPLILLSIWVYKERKRKRTSLMFSQVNLFKRVRPTLRMRFMGVPFILKILALILAVFALARPQQADVKVKKNVEGIDIVITLDISDSMLIEDMQPHNRLESAKIIIKEFIEGRISDRIGLVVFSGEAYTRVPLTLDYKLILESLSSIEITRNIKMGTALGVALGNSVARLTDSTAKSKIIVFLTDGENNSGTIDPETAIQIAKGYGIKIYSIGVGRDGETRLPYYITDSFGNKIKRYQPFYSAINEDLMQKMATETGGKFYRAIHSDALRNVLTEINRLERTKIEVNKFTRYSELFSSFLLWSLAIYLLSIFLGLSIFRRGP